MVSVITLQVTSSQLLSESYNFFLIDAASGNQTLTLPNIVADGLNFFFKRFDSTVNTNTVTLQGFNGSQTIDGAASTTVANNQAGRVIAFNSVWYSGQTNIPFPSSGNYISAYDTTTQSVAVANTFQTVTFGTRSLDGWTYSSGTFTCNQTGRYCVEYNAIASISILTGTASSRVTKNGTEVAGSQDSALILSTATGKLVKKFIAIFVSGDTLVMQLTGTATTISIDAGGSGTATVSASLVVTRMA